MSPHAPVLVSCIACGLLHAPARLTDVNPRCEPCARALARRAERRSRTRGPRPSR